MGVRERRKRYRERKKIAKYGAAAAGVDMRGRHGNHAHGEKNARWTGGRFITSHGYVAVRVPPDHHHAWGARPRAKYAYEHILVAEKKIGRRLGPNEVVHHENEVKTDNRPENLTVTSVGEHQREHAARRGRDDLGRFPPAESR